MGAAVISVCALVPTTPAQWLCLRLAHPWRWLETGSSLSSLALPGEQPFQVRVDSSRLLWRCVEQCGVALCVCDWSETGCASRLTTCTPSVCAANVLSTTTMRRL